MNPERFSRLAQAYGGDLARWPEAERAASQDWAAADPDARAVLDAARRLDAALSTYAPAAPTADLQRRIFGRLLAEPRPSHRLVGWIAALAALAGAGAIGAGATVGAAIVAVAPTGQGGGHAASGLYEQSSFGDFGSADGAAAEAPGA